MPAEGGGEAVPGDVPGGGAVGTGGADEAACAGVAVACPSAGWRASVACSAFPLPSPGRDRWSRWRRLAAFSAGPTTGTRPCRGLARYAAGSRCEPIRIRRRWASAAASASAVPWGFGVSFSAGWFDKASCCASGDFAASLGSLLISAHSSFRVRDFRNAPPFAAPEPFSVTRQTAISRGRRATSGGTGCRGSLTHHPQTLEYGTLSGTTVWDHRRKA